MADETMINGQAADDFQDFDENDSANVNELSRTVEGLEKEKSDLTEENQEMKEKLKKLTIEMEKVKGQEEETKEKLREMEKEMEQADDDKKVLESIAARALEEANTELGDLKRVLGEKGKKIDRLEMEIEVLKKEKVETEKKVREVESKLGVLKVKESEERSKRLRVEEEMRDKVDEKDKDIAELKKKVEDLEYMIFNFGKELKKWEKRLIEEALQDSEEEAKAKAKNMELKLLLLQKNTTDAENLAREMKETTVGAVNGNNTSADSEEDGKTQLPVLAIGSAGVVAVVVAVGVIYVCYLRRR